VISGLDSILEYCTANKFKAFKKGRHAAFIKKLEIDQSKFGSGLESAERAAAFAMCIGLVQKKISLGAPEFSRVLELAITAFPLVKKSSSLEPHLLFADQLTFLLQSDTASSSGDGARIESASSGDSKRVEKVSTGDIANGEQASSSDCVKVVNAPEPNAQRSVGKRQSKEKDSPQDKFKAKKVKKVRQPKEDDSDSGSRNWSGSDAEEDIVQREEKLVSGGKISVSDVHALCKKSFRQLSEDLGSAFANSTWVPDPKDVSSKSSSGFNSASSPWSFGIAFDPDPFASPSETGKRIGKSLFWYSDAQYADLSSAHTRLIDTLVNVVAPEKRHQCLYATTVSGVLSRMTSFMTCRLAYVQSLASTNKAFAPVVRAFEIQQERFPEFWTNTMKSLNPEDSHGVFLNSPGVFAANIEFFTAILDHLSFNSRALSRFVVASSSSLPTVYGLRPL